MFGLAAALFGATSKSMGAAIVTAAALTLTPSTDWAALRDTHIGVALQQELCKAHHWRQNVDAVVGKSNNDRTKNPFDLDPNTGELRLGNSGNINTDRNQNKIYAMQLLGIEYDDTFSWAWAAAEAATRGDSIFDNVGDDQGQNNNHFMPHLPADPQLICTALRHCEELQAYPEFSTTSPIPCTMTHNTEVLCEIATSILWQQAQNKKHKKSATTTRTTTTGGWVYQVPDYATGAIYTWLMEIQNEEQDENAIDNADNRDNECGDRNDDASFVSLSPTARLAAMVEKLVHPHYAHRVSSPTRAFRQYADALDMRTIVTSDPEEPVTQLTATPRNVFWGDSVLVFCDPNHDLITGISGQWGGALHTAFIEYDNDTLKFVELDRQPSLNLTTGEMINLDSDNDDGDSEKIVTANGDTKSGSDGSGGIPIN